MNWGDWQPQESILSSIRDVLQEALIPDSEIQKNVQEKIGIIQTLTDFTNYLLFILGNSLFAEDIRSLSGILLKNNLAAIYGTLPEDSTVKIREECLLLLKDPSREVRSSISNVIVAIAKDNLKAWPDLVPVLINLFTAQDEYSDVALHTLYKICEDLVNSQKQQIDVQEVTKVVFPKFLEYIDKDTCTIQIVKLTNQFLQDYFTVMKHSMDLGAYLRKIIEMTSTDDVELLKYVCNTFVVYMDNKEECLLPHLHDVILYLMDKSQHEDQDVALQACEFWFSTTRLNTCKDILGPYIDKLLPILLKNMKYSDTELATFKESLGVDSTAKDLSKDVCPFHLRERNNAGDEFDVDDPDDTEVFDDFYMGWTLRKCSAASLDSIAVKFGDDLLGLLVPFLNEILNHHDYLIKESAILALGAIAEGCLNGLKPHLPYLIQFLIGAMNDEQSLIRVITCWTLSRYALWIITVDVTPDTYFVPVLTILLKHFVDDNKRVQRAAISAFCIFQEEAQMKLVPYIDFILEAFHLGFQKFQHRSLYLLYDAIGVLAQSVGNNLSKQEYVAKLMPPLIQKISECDNYYDDHFMAVLECLSNLIPSLEIAFLPYSEVVYWHCLQLIKDTLLAAMRYEQHPNEFDIPDKDPMCVAHDVLYSMALGLKNHFIKYVTNSNLVVLLHKTMQDSSSVIRQSAVALYGELVMLCYPFLAGNINEFIPLIIKNLDEEYGGVCNNAAWVVGKLCSVMGGNIQPYLPEILAAFIHILRNPGLDRTMHKTVAVSLCIVFFVCPDVAVDNMDVVIKNCCLLIRNVRDSDEKDLAFRGLCQAVLRYPEFTRNNFVYFCDAVASWIEIRIDLKEIIKGVLLGYKEQVGEDYWREYYGQFAEPLKIKLQSLYGV